MEVEGRRCELVDEAGGCGFREKPESVEMVALPMGRKCFCEKGAGVEANWGRGLA